MTCCSMGPEELLEASPARGPYPATDWGKAANKVIADWRRKSLLGQSQVSKSLIRVLSSYHRSIVKQVNRTYSGSPLTAGQLANVEARVSELTGALSEDLRNLVQKSVLSSADLAAIRESRLALASYARDLPGPLSSAIARPFDRSTFVKGVTDVLWSQSLGGQVSLSNKLWVVGQYTEARVSAVIRAGVERGLSPLQVAKVLELELVPIGGSKNGLGPADKIWSRANAPERLRGLVGSVPKGIRTRRGTVSYNYLRIARTEMFKAGRASTIARALYLQGLPDQLNPIQGVRWNLSNSHPAKDICDSWASANPDGLGAGVYKPDNVPTGHPQDLCYTTNEVSSPQTFANSLGEFMAGRGMSEEALARYITTSGSQFLSPGLLNSLKGSLLGDPDATS